MWTIDELGEILKEMLPDGNIHNIVVFTVITSSSVLSVVGVLRHIYTFIYNVRHEQAIHQPTKESGTKTGELHSPTFTYLDDFPFVASFNRLAVINLDATKYSAQNREHLKRGDSPVARSKNGPTCLRCDKAMWERHCVYGLCHACCQRLGGCQQQGHKKQPRAYNPWPNSWHRSERIIDLSHLCLQELPPRLGFHHMDAHSLDVSYNSLTGLPEHMTLMRGLVSISLSHNLLSNIPAFCSSLHQLAYIDLRNNRLPSFPDSLLELPQLLKLYLDHNSLSMLPFDIDRLHFLQCLSLGFNDLTSIPDSLFNIQGLKSLNLRGNSKLSVLPSAVGNLICLQRLDVSHCDLRIIPASISSCIALRKCNVSFNRLTHLPCEISQCYRLVQLEASNNKMTFLPATLLFRQGVLLLAAGGNNFFPRQGLTSRWLLLNPVTLQGKRQVPALTSLSGSVVEKYSLDLSRLPLPVQDKLSSLSSCYHCGQKKVTNSIRAISFASFSQRHSQSPHRQLVQEYPFLYTFCHRHTQDCTMETLQACLDSLSVTHANDITD